MNDKAVLPRAARLFDEIIGAGEADKRQPLRKVYENRGDSRRPQPRRRHAASLQIEQASSPELWDSPKKRKPRAKKKVAFRDEGSGERNHKACHKASKNYPNCTKDSLLQAFENANLPDFEAIAQHQLNITVDRPGRKRGTPAPTPRISHLLRVFDEPVSTIVSDEPVSTIVSDPRLDPTRSSQKRIVTSSPPLISVQQACYRRRKQATLIDPILLSLDSDRDAPHSSVQQSLSCSTEEPTVREASRRSSRLMVPTSRSSVTTVQGACTERSTCTDGTESFAVPAVPLTPLHRHQTQRSFMEPHSLREDAFGPGVGMTSTPLVTQKRAFLKPHTVRPLVSSARMMHAPAASASFHLHSSLALSTGWTNRSNMSVVRSQLQSAGKLHRLISCPSAQLNETVVADRDELRDTIGGSFATAFSVAKIIVPSGELEILTPQDKVLALCNPQTIISLNDVFTTEVMKGMKKIGEGSFGEIFESKSLDGLNSVWKLVPFNLEDEEIAIFAQILPEVMILSTFNRLRESVINKTSNFISMTRAAIVRGAFPDKLLHEWDEFHRLKQSENPDPRIYKEDNLHLLMVLNHGGVDLEHVKLKSADQAVGIFMQCAFSLAAAEAEFEFEHRDLHWGNILVRNTADESAEYVVSGCPFQVPTGGVHVSIIDFTLSRISKDGYTVYDDLSKYSDLFTGDANVDFQFEVYRLMAEENGGDWGHFCPRTNILWLNYLLDKLLYNKKYSSRSKNHKRGEDMLRKLHKNVLGFKSSKDLAESSFVQHLLAS